jgi:hypothetical protein
VLQGFFLKKDLDGLGKDTFIGLSPKYLQREVHVGNNKMESTGYGTMLSPLNATWEAQNLLPVTKFSDLSDAHKTVLKMKNWLDSQLKPASQLTEAMSFKHKLMHFDPLRQVRARSTRGSSLITNRPDIRHKNARIYGFDLKREKTTFQQQQQQPVAAQPPAAQQPAAQPPATAVTTEETFHAKSLREAVQLIKQREEVYQSADEAFNGQMWKMCQRNVSHKKILHKAMKELLAARVATPRRRKSLSAPVVVPTTPSAVAASSTPVVVPTPASSSTPSTGASPAAPSTVASPSTPSTVASPSAQVSGPATPTTSPTTPPTSPWSALGSQVMSVVQNNIKFKFMGA